MIILSDIYFVIREDVFMEKTVAAVFDNYAGAENAAD